MRRLNKEALTNSKLYQQLFGGICEITFKPELHEYQLHIKNDDVGIFHCYIPVDTVTHYDIEVILNQICEQYLATMRYNNIKLEKEV